MGILDRPLRNGIDGSSGPAGPPGPLGNAIVATYSSGTISLNPAYGTDYVLTLTGNVSLTASGMINGSSIYVEILQDGIGGRTVDLSDTWMGYADAEAGVDTSPNAVTAMVIWKTAGGYRVNVVMTGTLNTSYWSPDALANRVAWFDANSIQGDDGDTVAVWNNPWGVGGTISGGPVLKVLNGEKYVQFDGSDDHVDSDRGSNVAQPFVYAFLAKVPGNGPVISGTAGQTSALDVETVSGNWQVDPGTSGPTRPNTGNWQTVVIEILTGGDDTFRVDGSQVTGAVGTLKVGRWLRFGASDGGTHTAMSLANFIEVSGTIDSTTRTNIETYLNAKRDYLNGI